MSGFDNTTNCKICHQIFSSPKVLPCLHIFCKECLSDLHNLSNDGTLSCPTCQEKFDMTFNDLDMLSSHIGYANIVKASKIYSELSRYGGFANCSNCSCEEPKNAIKYCIKCQELLCEYDLIVHDNYSNDHPTLTLEEMKYAKLFDILPKDISIPCKLHPDRNLKYYCKECNETICKLCGITNHLHETKLSELSEMTEIMSSSLREKTQDLIQKSKELERTKECYKEELVNLNIAKNSNIAEIKEEFEKLRQTLEFREKELLSKSETHYEEQETIMSRTIKMHEELIEKMHSVNEFFEQNLNHFPPHYLYSLYDTIRDRSDQLKKEIPKHNLKINKANFKVFELSKIIEKLENIGSILSENFPNFNKPIQKLTAKELGFNEDTNINCITADLENNLKIQLSKKNGTNKEQIIQTVNSLNIPINSKKYTTLFQQQASMVMPANGDIVFIDPEKKNLLKVGSYEEQTASIISNDLDNLNDPNCIAMTRNKDNEKYTVVLNKESEIHILDENYSLESQFATVPRRTSVSSIESRSSSASRSSSSSSPPNSRPGSRQDRVVTPKAIKNKKSLPVVIKPTELNEKLLAKPINQRLALNSKNQIIFAHEKSSKLSFYDLNGKKVDEIDYELYTKVNREMDPVAKLSSSGKRPLLRTNSPLANQVSAGRNSQTIEAQRTVIATDSLDNLYVYRKNTIYIFDANKNFIKKEKMSENFEANSIVIDNFGQVYILSTSGIIFVFN